MLEGVWRKENTVDGNANYYGHYGEQYGDSLKPGNRTAISQFSLSVVSNYLRPHESQHARPTYPSPSPGVHSNSRPSSQ